MFRVEPIKSVFTFRRGSKGNGPLAGGLVLRQLPDHLRPISGTFSEILRLGVGA